MSFFGFAPYKVAFAAIPIHLVVATIPHALELIVSANAGVWDNKEPRETLNKLKDEKKVHPNTAGFIR